MREWFMEKRAVKKGNLECRLAKRRSEKNRDAKARAGKKRFGRTRLAGLLVMIACMAASLSARADVIWEPQDSFYEKHASECDYVNRLFEANGPDGKVILYQSPEMPIEKGSWENGYRAYISFVYTDSEGVEWGIYDNGAKLSGWVPMAYMEVVYDSISFKEEHSTEIVKQQGELDGKYQGEEIYLWKYPGSEEGQAFQVEDYPPSYQSVYVDAEGRSWGCIGYYFGIKDKWICLDQPAADFDELYPEGIEKPGESRNVSSERERPEKEETERIVPKMGGRTVIIAVIMVTAVVLATAVLLVILKKRHK